MAVGKTKPFSETLYKQNDSLAKEKIKEFLLNNFCDEVIDKETKGVDLIAIRNGLRVGFEVERRPDWKSKCFNFKTVHVPSRKEKVLNNNTHYVQINNQCTNIIVTTGKRIKESPLVEVSNKYMRSGEYFYDVPIKSFIPVNLLEIK